MVEETTDPEATCAGCATRKLLGRFPLDFGAWMVGMIDLYHRSQAGWRIGNDDLSLEEWRAMARIAEWYALKREEARCRLAGVL